MIDPDNTNQRRTTHNNEQGNHRGTNYQSDDDNDERSDNQPILLQHRLNKIREDVTDQLDNIRARVMEQRSMARLHGDGTPTSASLATNSPSTDHQSGNGSHVPINAQEQDTPPNLLTVTAARVLEMGSARWKDASSRMILLGQSFRGLEDPSLSESNFEHESTPRAEVSGDQRV